MKLETQMKIILNSNLKQSTVCSVVKYLGYFRFSLHVTLLEPFSFCFPLFFMDILFLKNLNLHYPQYLTYNTEHDTLNALKISLIFKYLTFR